MYVDDSVKSFIFSILLVYMVAQVVLGLMFAPLAVAHCWIIAHRRNLSVWRYAIRGGAYSAMLFVPWLYLAARMEGKAIPFVVGAVVYGLHYASWFCLGILLPIIGIQGLSEELSGLPPSFASEESIRSLRTISVAITAAISLLWAASLLLLLRRYRADRQDKTRRRRMCCLPARTQGRSGMPHYLCQSHFLCIYLSLPRYGIDSASGDEFGAQAPDEYRARAHI